jgi:hypothetical protein
VKRRIIISLPLQIRNYIAYLQIMQRAFESIDPAYGANLELRYGLYIVGAPRVIVIDALALSNRTV